MSHTVFLAGLPDGHVRGQNSQKLATQKICRPRKKIMATDLNLATRESEIGHATKEIIVNYYK